MASHGRQGHPSSMTLEALAEKVARLESERDQRIATQVKLRFQVHSPETWLGFDQTLILRVTDGFDRPLARHPITLVTTWGLLSGGNRAVLEIGHSLSVTSDHLGLCRIKQKAPLGHLLSDTQRSALINGLQVLNGRSAANEAREAIRDLVRLYRSPDRHALRQAVDALFSQFAQPDQYNGPPSSAGYWTSIPVTVFAYETPATDQSSSGLPMALTHLTQRNWLHSWERVFRQVLDEDNNLRLNLEGLRNGNRGQSRVLADFAQRVQLFIDHEQGLVGKQVGQRFAEATVNDYMQGEMAEFSGPERLNLITGMDSTAKLLENGERLFTAMQSERSSIERTVQEIPERELAPIRDRVINLEAETIKEQDFTRWRSELTDTVDQRLDTKVNVGDMNLLEEQVQNLGSQSQQLVRDLDHLGSQVLEQVQGQFREQLQQLEQDNRDMNRKLGQLDGRFDNVVVRDDLQRRDQKFERQLQQVQEQMDGKADTRELEQMNEQIRTLEKSNNRTDKRFNELDNRFQDVVVRDDLRNLNQQLNQVQRGNRQLQNQVSGLNQQVANKANASDVNNLNTQLGQLQSKTNTLDSRLRNVRIDPNNPIIRR